MFRASPCYPSCREIPKGASSRLPLKRQSMGLSGLSIKQTPQSRCCSANHRTVSDLWQATANSAGLDLCSTSHAVLTPETGAQVLGTGIYGLPPAEMFGLILGRASAVLRGLQVIPGVIDNDCTGEIKIIASASSGVMTVPLGNLLLPL